MVYLCHRQYTATEFSSKLDKCFNKIQRTPEHIYDKSPLSARFYWHYLKHVYAMLRYAPRLVIKDPIAAFSAEWLCRTFDMDVVVVVRHPAAVVHSLVRLNWLLNFRTHILSQTELVREHLSDYLAVLERVGTDDPIGNAAVQWLITYKVLGDYIDRNPNWLVVWHENLALEPLLSFEELYGRLGLIFDDTVVKGIRTHTQDSNPVAAPQGQVTYLKRNSRAVVSWWRKSLSHEEVARIRTLTEPVASRYYKETDWAGGS